MKTVMIFGTFDGVHEGHRFLFRQAKKYGDRLTVVVARDETVQRVKGRLPKYPESVRYAALFGEKEIDEVVLGNRRDRYEAIRKYRPDIICLGYDQERFVGGLDRVFKGKVFRLSSFSPEIFKSSKMPKEKDFVVRAKAALRSRLMERRRKMSETFRECEAKSIEKVLLDIPEIHSAKTIALYKPIFGEVDITELFSYFWKKEKIVLAPLSLEVVSFAVVTPQTQYQEMRGFSLPANEEKYTGAIDAAVIPCVGYDKKGNRLGSGVGWYDRFLAEHEETVAIGVGFSIQQVACVPVEAHDKKMHRVCTVENGIGSVLTFA